MPSKQSHGLRQTTADLKRILEALPVQQNESPLTAYRNDPVGYARDVLKVRLWDKQAEILQSLLHPPYRTLVKSGHSVGKSFLAAVATNWWYDTRPRSVAITTGPTNESVKDIVWKEIRVLRLKAGLGGFQGSEAPLLKSGPDHYAKGRTAESGEAFQGRHDLEMLFVFDEAVGIPPIFWTTTNTMFRAENGHAWLAICNPTDTTSQAYQEESLILGAGGPKWNAVQMSALDHPNIAAELAGQTRPYPSAVTLQQIWDAIHEGCQQVTEAGRPSDFEFPPESGTWWRPGPIFQSRWLGLWPDSSEGVWSDSKWKAALRQRPLPGLKAVPQIGCDVARFGRDYTVFHTRWGNCSVAHARYNGWSTMQTAGELIRLAIHWAKQWNAIVRPQWMPALDPKSIVIVLDDDGVGGGVTDRVAEQGYTVFPVSAGSEPTEPELYPNLRSQLWFSAADRADTGTMDLSRIDQLSLALIKQQAMAPTWKLDSAGRRVVEKKEDTKKKIGCSPDDMDAVNLAYFADLDVGGEPMVLGTNAQARIGTDPRLRGR
jgi:hypothetical protein